MLTAVKKNQDILGQTNEKFSIVQQHLFAIFCSELLFYNLFLNGSVVNTAVEFIYFRLPLSQIKHDEIFYFKKQEQLLPKLHLRLRLKAQKKSSKGINEFITHQTQFNCFLLHVRTYTHACACVKKRFVLTVVYFIC